MKEHRHFLGERGWAGTNDDDARVGRGKERSLSSSSTLIGPYHPPRRFPHQPIHDERHTPSEVACSAAVCRLGGGALVSLVVRKERPKLPCVSHPPHMPCPVCLGSKRKIERQGEQWRRPREPMKLVAKAFPTKGPSAGGGPCSFSLPPPTHTHSFLPPRFYLASNFFAPAFQ